MNRDTGQPAGGTRRKAVLVSFEGIDGCGKSTQARMFRAWLGREGIPTLFLREPGGTVLGDCVRRLLLHGKMTVAPWSELLLYLASRAQLVEEKIRPSLEKDIVIVLDRYLDSTVAYQGYGRKLPRKLIREIHDAFLSDAVPDLTFVIDESPEELARFLARKARDRMEKETLFFQKMVRNGYLETAKRNRRFCVIRRGSRVRTFESIIREWRRFLHETGRDTVFSQKRRGKR